jgi:hypothetical protein
MGGMARPLRLESESGVYHVLNRGNYRLDLFRSEKTKAAFLATHCCPRQDKKGLISG